MSSLRNIAFTSLGVALLACSLAGAQDVEPTVPTIGPMPRKQKSLLYRATQPTATKQLAYARELRDAGKAKRAGAQYQALVHTWHTTKEAQQAQFEYAELLEKRRKFKEAFDEYQYMIDYYAGTFPYAEVLDRQFRIANHMMTQQRKVFGLFSSSIGMDRAMPMFEKIVANGPEWERSPLAQFNIGWIHEQLKSLDLATAAYETVEHRYPDTPAAANATYRRGYCLYLVAKRYRREERSSQVARTHLANFLRKHPKHEHADTARAYMAEITSQLADMYYARALFYDKKISRPRSALIAYTDFLNKFSDAKMAEVARQRVAILKADLEKPDADAQ